MSLLRDEYPSTNPAARKQPAYLGTTLSGKSDSPSVLIEEIPFSSEMPRASHWSVAWSDLMMTMFILFLSMFVYQSAQQDFLSKKTPEIVGGKTTDALDILDVPDISTETLPPTTTLSSMGERTMPEITPMEEDFPLLEEPETPAAIERQPEPVASSLPKTEQQPSALAPPQNLIAPPPEADIVNTAKEEIKEEMTYGELQANNIAIIMPETPGKSNTEEVFPPPPAPMTIESHENPSLPQSIASETVTSDIVPRSIHDESIFPRPITDEPQIVERTASAKREQYIQATKNLPSQFQKMYNLSKDNLHSQKLEKFATVDLTADKTVRIILTGDLLFGLGESALSPQSLSALKNITEVIRNTPYMINVVGHTDNVPMSSGKFPSNWELSVARASSVARFLINEMGMNPNQFVVSGYASYRPVKPNTTTTNRSINRRVEIIISKRLPQPQPATPQNLN